MMVPVVYALACWILYAWYGCCGFVLDCFGLIYAPVWVFVLIGLFSEWRCLFTVVCLLGLFVVVVSL